MVCRIFWSSNSSFKIGKIFLLTWRCALSSLLFQASEEFNAHVSDTFIQFFLRVIGHYPAHIKWSRNGTGSFQGQSFCKALTSKTNRRFVKKFVKTQMFSLFIQEAEKSKKCIEGKFLGHSGHVLFCLNITCSPRRDDSSASRNFSDKGLIMWAKLNMPSVGGGGPFQPLYSMFYIFITMLLLFLLMHFLF